MLTMAASGMYNVSLEGIDMYLEADNIVSELGSIGVAILVTQPE